MKGNKFKKRVEKYKGQLVLDSFNVAKIEDFMEDDEDNWYGFRTWDNKFYWSSCVGSFTPLKNKLSNKEYTKLLYHFNLNIECHNTDGSFKS
jgi:hypothetical protein